MTEKVAVLLPAYNEEKTIGLTIDDVLSSVPYAEVVVIDNNCKDHTAEIAEQFGAVVLKCTDQGKGCAVRKAFAAVDADYYVMIDSDYTYPARHIPDILRLLRHRADVVIGYRQWQAKGAIARTNKLGNWGLTTMAGLLNWYPVRDVCSGMWGFRREAVEKIVLRSSGFTLEVELFVEAVRTGCQIEQIPIEYRTRFGDSKSKLRLSTGLEIGWWLLQRKLRESRPS